MPNLAAYSMNSPGIGAALRGWIRAAGLGKLALRIYHGPVGRFRTCLQEGGPIEQFRTERGRRAMEAAARVLPPLPEPPGAVPLALHLLTGRRYWFQSAFCLWTFARHAGRPLAPVIHDDGTLESAHRDALVRLFPRIRFDGRRAIIARLDEYLPHARFPVLRTRADNFPLLHKLLDPHVGSRGWKLLIDSDLLFFHRPALLVDWLDRPGRPLRATDVVNAYGYPLELLAELAGRPVDERVNTGLLGLRSDAIDWERLEFWCRELQQRAGTHYYQEQAIVALLLAGQDCTVAPLNEYVTLPRPPEADDCRAVMHHYVSTSKRWYFQHNWRKALAPAA